MADRPNTQWLRLAQSSAVMVGIGAFSAAHVHANAPARDATAGTEAGISLHLQDGKIYLTEPGRPPEELPVDGPQGQALRQLLQNEASDGPVRVQPLIVADGAGGVQWVRPRNDTPPASTENTQKGAQMDAVTRKDGSHAKATSTGSKTAE